MPGLDRKYTAEAKRAKQAEEDGKQYTPELKVAKSYNVDPRNIRIIDGFNVRKISQEHVDALALAFERGDPIPPVLVAIGAEGELELVDGEHRVRAAIKADMRRINVFEFEGTEEQRVAIAISSSQGRNLSPDERAMAYKRLRNKGWTDKEIADSVGRSEGDVANHILLADCGPEVLEMVAKEEIKATPVFKLARELGAQNVYAKLQEVMASKQAEMAAAPAPEPVKPADGKKKKGTKPGSTKAPRVRITGTDLMGFTKKDFERLAELATKLEIIGDVNLAEKADNVSVTLRCDAQYLRELMPLIDRFAITSA